MNFWIIVAVAAAAPLGTKALKYEPFSGIIDYWDADGQRIGWNYLKLFSED